MASYRFQLVGGMHMDVEGNVYMKGDVVKSEEDLRKKYPNKFELLTGDGIPEVEKKKLGVEEAEAIEALGERRRSRKEVSESEDEGALTRTRKFSYDED